MALNRDEIKASAVSSIQRISGIEPGENRLFSISLPENYKPLLIKHFEGKGLSMMAGCRMILLDYMRKEGLI